MKIEYITNERDAFMIETIPILLKVPSYHRRFWTIVRLVHDSLLESGLTYKFKKIGSQRPRRRGSPPRIIEESDFASLYPHWPVIILNAQIAQFVGQELGLWIVTGEGAIETVTKNKGSNNDPAECALHTWRFKIGEMMGCRRMTLLDLDRKPSVTVFDNFIHVPKRDEVGRDMEVLRKFI